MKEDLSYVELGEVANVVMGQSPASTTIIEMSSQGAFPFLQGCAEFGDKYPNANSWCVAPTKVSSGESVLFSVRAPVGKINLAYDKYCIGRGLASIEPLNAKDLLFLYYIMGFNTGQFQRLSQGSTFDAIDSKNLRKFKIMFPKNSTERLKIVELLTQIDSNIEKTKSIIKKYKNIKQGLMQDLLTKGIDELGNIRSEGTHQFKDSPIGRVPITWDKCLISQYISFQKSGLSRKISHEDIGIPVLTSGNIDNNSNLDIKELKYWYESDPQGANVADYILDNGDILLCFINSIEQMGKLCIFDDIGRPCIYTTNLFRIKASANTTPKFLYYLLLSHYVQNEIRVITKPAINQASFTKQDFAKTKVPLISVEEQAKIVEALDSANARIETEITHLNKLTLLKQGLMQDLLTGTVRVPLEEATG